MKQLVATLLLLISFNLVGQDKTKIVPVNDFSLEVIPNEYCFEDNGLHYIKYLKITDRIQFGKFETQGIGMICYDGNLNKAKSFELYGKEKEEKILHSFFIRKNIILISYHKRKEEKMYKYYKYDLNGNLTNEVELITLGKKEDPSFLLSPDSSKIAIVYIEDNDDKKTNIVNHLVVLDYEGKILWKKEQDLGFLSRTYDVKTSFLSNAGKYYQTTNSYDKKSKTYTTHLHIISETKLSTLPVNTTSFLGCSKIKQIKDEIYYSGIEYNIADEIYDKLFISKITDELTEVKITPQTIPAAFLEPLIKNKFYKMDIGWDNRMTLQHAWQNERGEIRLAYDVSYISSERGGSIVYNYFNNENTYIFSLDNEMNIKSVKLCPKSTATELQTLMYPVNSKVIGDDLYIIYNEHKNNVGLTSIDMYKKKGDNVPIVRKFSPDGKIKDIILSQSEKESYVVPNSSGFTQNNEVLFITFESSLFKTKNLKLGLIPLE